MSRSVVTRGTVRCPECLLAPRWCICAGYQAIHSRLAIDVLIHLRESRRPTSTGLLLTRLLPDARRHLYQPGVPPQASTLVRPGKALWILDPSGDEIPSPPARPEDLQVLLLDGSWREAVRMRKEVESWGRLVRLPPSGTDKFQLRNQHAEGMSSTAEALLRLVEALGLAEMAAALRVQLDLHVYAGLRSRGAVREAEELLTTSPLPAALPEVLRALQERRRCGPPTPQPPPTPHPAA